MTSGMQRAVFIEPPSWHFQEDRLFDLNDARLNRDGSLLPFARLREHLQAQGVAVHTADRLRAGSAAVINEYWSLGIRTGYQEFVGRDDVILRGFLLMEPSLVARGMYAALPELSQHFQRVYLHNTSADGYSLQGVNESRLDTFYWPQPYESEQEPFWSRTDRENKLVVIAGHHHPKFRKPEYYSKRIEAVGALAARGGIDLFGRGWDRWWAKESVWLPYWLNRRALMRVYRGGCESKFEVLSRYRFSLCFENMPMAGYVTEKIFDCLYAGTVPVYLGAPDIDALIPSEVYVDMRQFDFYETMYEHIAGMSADAWQRKREAGRTFLRGLGRERYFNSFINLMAGPVGIDA